MARLAEPADGPSARAVAAVAVRHGLAVGYGYPERNTEEHGVLHNSLLLVGADGVPLANYRKTHLYGAFENQWFTPGDDGVVQAEVGGLTVGLMICYDVEFPENVRAQALAGTDLLLVPTALMHPAEVVAESVVPVRAFENQLYIAYANRTGPEGDFEFVGLSVLAAPDGTARARAGHGEDLVVGDVDPAFLAASRELNPYLRDRRPDLYGPWSEPPRPPAPPFFPCKESVPHDVHGAQRRPAHRRAAADHHVRSGLPVRLRRLPGPPGRARPDTGDRARHRGRGHRRRPVRDHRRVRADEDGPQARRLRGRQDRRPAADRRLRGLRRLADCRDGRHALPALVDRAPALHRPGRPGDHALPEPVSPATPSTVVDLKGESHYAETIDDLPQVYRDVAAAWGKCLEEGADFSDMNTAMRERDVPRIREIWAQLVEKLDNQTFYGFLCESEAFKSFRHREIFGQVGFGTGGWDTDFPNSILEILRVVYTEADDHHRGIVGGSQQLPLRLWEREPRRSSTGRRAPPSPPCTAATRSRP